MGRLAELNETPIKFAQYLGAGLDYLFADSAYIHNGRNMQSDLDGYDVWI